MTRYYTDLSHELVNLIRGNDLQVPEHWRLIERWGPRDSNMERWIVEDDYADEKFEDCLVTPVFTMMLIDDGPEYTVTVTGREIISVY